MTNATAVSRIEQVTAALFAAALLTLIPLKLLPALIAGLLVYTLVHAMVPTPRTPAALGAELPRVVNNLMQVYRLPLRSRPWCARSLCQSRRPHPPPGCRRTKVTRALRR